MYIQIKRVLLIILCAPAGLSVFGQPGASVDLTKPKKYENRRLGSEKTEEKKFGVPRKFIQNTVTHYNYFYNANNKINEVLERSKAGFKDDYTKLLPFYNYSLETTASYKQDLDSVISKSTAGILLHDLRNSWIDDLYLLIGKAYYYRNTLDSAYTAFQYVNRAFAPRDKEGYDQPIGSNTTEGGNAINISTVENRNLVKRALSEPPSRNDALIWEIKTYLANGEMADAAGLIQTLRNDPTFPERLYPELSEVQAYFFYLSNIPDSTAFYLEQALPNAGGREEECRWLFLIGQLYEKAGNQEASKAAFEKVIKRTINPVMEVYARLNAVHQHTGERETDEAVSELLKMARRDKYILYRDIIYYTAAMIEADRQRYDVAQQLLLKSVATSMDNPAQKSNSYLELGSLAYYKGDYVAAKNYYDSVDVNVFDDAISNKLQARKTALAEVVKQTLIIQRQDSVQYLASLPEKEREEIIKKIVRKLRRQSGLKDEDYTGSGTASSTMQAPDLFAQGGDSKAAWYFYNPTLRTSGLSAFKSKWGNRPNVDNWRKMSAISNSATNPNNNMAVNGQNNNVAAPAIPDEITVASLTARLPLTPESMKISNDSTESALYALGLALQNDLEAYESAIKAYEKLLEKFPSTVVRPNALFNLYYCYSKLGRTEEQMTLRKQLQNQYPNNKLTELASGKKIISPEDENKKIATALYEDIYNQFIEGNFAEAVDKKKKADSSYGASYWTPQLLYIEAIYHIRQREDSIAMFGLTSLMQRFPSSPMYTKSANLLNVLRRRTEIENYLTQLQLEMPKEDSAVAVVEEQKPAIKEEYQPTRDVVSKQDSAQLAKTAPKNIDVKINKPGAPSMGIDTSLLFKKPAIPNNQYSFNPDQEQYVILVMDKVDPVYVSEARNAFNRYNKEKYYTKTFELSNLSLTDDVKILLFKSFDNAASAWTYIDKAKKLAATEIIPWLTANKYSFLLISADNLEKLMNTKDLDAYRKFMHAVMPQQF